MSSTDAPQAVKSREDSSKSAVVAMHPPEEPETLSPSAGSLVPIIVLISIATFGSYLLGRFHFSIVWTSIFLFLTYNFMFRRVARLRRYHRHALERDVARQRLERHAESAEWLNFIAVRLWTVLEPVISVKVTERVNAVLEEACPSFLDSLMLTEFTLGSSAPTILSARVHPKTQPDVVHLDVEVCFIPKDTDTSVATGDTSSPQWNSKVVLNARMGKGRLGVDVPVMLKEISIFGKLRLQLELGPTVPFVNKIQLGFLETPRFDFILKPLKSFDLMDLPGLSNWISSSLTETINDTMVDPNMVVIPLRRSYSDVRSIGVLKVSLYEVRGMKLVGNLVQPFVKVQIGNKNKAISTVLDPSTMSWNQVFYILIHTLKNPVSFVIMGTPTSMLGSVTFPISDLELDMTSSKNVWRTVVGHESSKIRGELNFGIEYYPAADEPDPEADLNFESGIVQISLHQLKDLFGEDKKGVTCCYEVYVHPSNFKFDWKDPPRLREGKQHRSRTKRRTNNPTWDEVFEVFLEHKDESSVTILLRHGTKDEVVYGKWTAPFSQLLNRTDWFSFDEEERAQFYASFLFRPVRIDVSSSLDLNFTSCLGVARIHVISGSGFKACKGGYRVAVDISGRLAGKTKAAVVESSPVWNKHIVTIAKDSKDVITLDVQHAEKGTSYGHVSCTIAELLAHEGCDIERNNHLADTDGDTLPAKLRFTVGIYPAQNLAPPPEEEPYNLVDPEVAAMRSNCGILEVHSISVDGVLPTTINSLHYLKVAFENCDPFLTTTPAHIGGEGKHSWKKRVEYLIQDYDCRNLHFTITETHGAKEEFVDALSVRMMNLRGNEPLKLEGMTQGSISIRATYRPVRLELEPEVEESGVLQIQLKSAEDLIAVDSNGTSDPFCVLRLNGTKFFKSSVIKKCLSPVFEENAEVEIKQRDISILQVELRDWNKVTASRTLGMANIELQNLPPNKWQDLKLSLENVSSGMLHIRLIFIPEQDGRGRRRLPTENVIAVPSPTKTFTSPELVAILGNQDTKTDLTTGSTADSKMDSMAGSTMSSVADSRTSSRVASPPLQTDKEITHTLESAAGVKITIVGLEIHEPIDAFDCKVKIRNGNRTIFKTRGIKNTEHRWNESFTIEPENMRDLHVVLTWDQHPTDIPLRIANVPDSEQHLELPLTGINGKLILKYSATMDTQHLVDTKHRRRFSFLAK
ncbi:Tcb1p [Paramicrosporidium saccamoebae]|uniref:Tcb1p n=1 Tax=Paramicrosporidium saccamoebae TaxID=1246581 RepID=A0A2H9TNV5_9FUNG|nr:Tcb1p [Paramicrosporidium saccamoebae]